MYKIHKRGLTVNKWLENTQKNTRVLFFYLDFRKPRPLYRLTPLCYKEMEGSYVGLFLMSSFLFNLCVKNNFISLLLKKPRFFFSVLFRYPVTVLWGLSIVWLFFRIPRPRIMYVSFPFTPKPRRLLLLVFVFSVWFWSGTFSIIEHFLFWSFFLCGWPSLFVLPNRERPWDSS